MDAALRMLRTLRLTLLVFLVFYSALCFWVPAQPTPAPVMFRAIVIVAISEVILIFVFRSKFISQSEPLLAANPDHAATMARWRDGHIVCWALSLSIAFYGVILRYLGFTFSQVLPFLLAGFVLLSVLPPRRPSGS